jgi:hypothetical protein
MNSETLQSSASGPHERRRPAPPARPLALSVIVALLLLMPSPVSGQRFRSTSQQFRRERVAAVFRLTPHHRSSSISHDFIGATVGFYSKRLVVPRGLRAELLIRTSVESLTGQPPDVALCTPERFCRARGLLARPQCHDTGRWTICQETNPPTARDPIFPPGPFTLTVQEFEAKRAGVSFKVVFIRGYG